MTQTPPLETSAETSPHEYSSDALHARLRDVFGFEEFRALQEDVVAAVASGRDVLVVMPTGAGKSLCYQLPAAIASGVTLVVSPLVALMRDQVLALQERTAFAELGCAFLNSSQSQTEQRETLDLLRAGTLKILYVAPERFRASGFIEALKSTSLARLVVDEAHCISQWGHDFRPDYLALKNAVEVLGRPPLTAVTATATKRVQDSIVANLGMRDPQVFIGGFDRPNLHFSAIKCKNDSERGEKLIKALPKLASRGGSGLIYVATRKQCQEVAGLASHALAPLGIKAASYHAGLESNLRNEVQSAWLNGEIHVLVATNAFGMGVDKSDVRYVIHWVYPESPEAYYQEAGRAGRDGRKSRAVVLHHFSDKRLREFFIENDALTVEKIQSAHLEICRRAQSQPAQPEYSDDRFAGDANVVAIPKSWWQMALGWNDMTARSVLGKLDHFGLIEKLTENADATILKITGPQISFSLRGEIENHLASEMAERRARLDEMIAYCKATSCRRRMLLEYFGDEREATPREYCCDVCEAPEKFQSAPVEAMPNRVAPSTAETHDLHDLLQNLDALRPRVGKSKLEKLLRGAKSKEIERFKDHPLLGIFAGCSQTQVTDFLNDLVAQGFLAQAGEDEYFVMFVTSSGRAAWQEKQELKLEIPRAFAARTALDEDEPGAELFEELRAWRRRCASEEHVPPYCVLGDKTLRAIAAIKPDDEDALAQVPGIGAKKLEKYASGILDVVRAA